MTARDPHDLALELYSRGFTHTRQEAVQLVTENPDGAAFLIGLSHIDREMRHPEDIASIEDWGHAG